MRAWFLDASQPERAGFYEEKPQATSVHHVETWWTEMYLSGVTSSPRSDTSLASPCSPPERSSQSRASIAIVLDSQVLVIGAMVLCPEFRPSPRRVSPWSGGAGHVFASAVRTLLSPFNSTCGTARPSTAADCSVSGMGDQNTRVPSRWALPSRDR